MGEVDGEAPLSEYKQVRLDGVRGAIERVAWDAEDVIAGYAQAAWHRGGGDDEGHWAIEMCVAPDHRAGSLPGVLLDEVVAAVGDTAVTLWAPSPYAVTAAQATGWRRFRLLLRLTCRLPVDGCRDDTRFTLTTFRPGIDEQVWLNANNEAFAGHPENGALTLADLHSRMRQPWFDPEGFFLAWNDGRVTGSCWTKLHPGGVGEIYIIGVVPTWEGRGLGTALMCRGLDYLHRVKQATRAILYQESDNAPAAHIYERLGFTLDRRIEAYTLDTA
jgi:mycothiol synthase